MTDYHTDGTIVEGIVGRHIEERHLQDACGEANLVGGGVIVGIYRLGSHVPVIIVYGFTGTVFNTVVVPELLAGQCILKK